MKTAIRGLSTSLPLNILHKECVRKSALAFGIILLPITVAVAQNESVYTGLNEKDCKTIEFNEQEGWYRGECQGVDGFKLEVTEGDLRQSINIISPAGDKFELDFWRISGGFSSVGAKAEWRMSKATPIALIVRFNANQSEDPTTTTSYLIVVKVSKTAACITDIINPSHNQNAEARKLADEAEKKPCKTFE